MNRGNKNLHRSLQSETKHFFQPLALILIVAVFILLILISGIMDMRRIDSTLMGFMKNRGADIISNIQRNAQVSFSNLDQIMGGEHASEALSPFSEETYHNQEILIQSLVNLCRYFDQALKHRQRGKEAPMKMADQESLRIVAVIDDGGRIAFQSCPVPKTILDRAAPVVAHQKEIAIDLVNRVGRNEWLGSVVVRRISGEGTILLVLDKTGFQFWGLRVAVQRAINEAGWGDDVAYIYVMNDHGTVLGSSDYIDEKWQEDSLLDLKSRDAAVFSHRKINYQGRNIVEIIGPMSMGGDHVGIVRIGLERDRMDLILRENRTNMIISMSAIILIGVLSIWFLFQNQNKNLKRIEEMSKKLQQSERLSSLGQLAAGVAHEIRNPLNAISMACQRMQREYLPVLNEAKGAEFKGLTGVVRDEIRRLNGIIEDFLSFSRTDRLDLKEHPIEDILLKLANLVEEEAAAKGVLVKREWSNSKSLVHMDIDKLQQALLNIIKNGIESITQEGILSIGVNKKDRSVLVRISDTGSGVRPEEVDRIFSPDFTTKEKGLGLGLPIAHEIIQAHGGTIHVKSQIGVGSTFEILFPVKSR